MLSFLREQGNVDLPAQKSNGPADKTSGDDAGKSQEQQYYTVAAHGKRARKSTIFLIVLFVIGLFGLWFMVKKSSPEAASAAPTETEEVQIEAAIARLTGVKSEMFNRMDEIVSKFYEFAEVLQVQVSELAKNPFKIEMFLANFNVEAHAEDGELDQLGAELLWQEQIRRKAAKMQLLSIMRSDQGSRCMIDDEILEEGDSLEGFKIVQIGKSHVKLEWDSEDDSEHPETEIVLRLSE